MTVLKVSKVSNPHSVAGAIAGLVRDHGRAVMQAIGASATNQAVKAIAIARSFMREEGADLLARITFLDVEFGGETRTALRFEIADRSGYPADEAPVDPASAVGTVSGERGGSAPSEAGLAPGAEAPSVDTPSASPESVPASTASGSAPSGGEQERSA